MGALTVEVPLNRPRCYEAPSRGGTDRQGRGQGISLSRRAMAYTLTVLESCLRRACTLIFGAHDPGPLFFATLKLADDEFFLANVNIYRLLSP